MIKYTKLSEIGNKEILDSLSEENINLLKETLDYEDVYKANQFANKLGFDIPDEVMLIIIKADINLLYELKHTNKESKLDTYVRDIIVHNILKYFNINMSWPINNDKQEYILAFLTELHLKCPYSLKIT